MNSVKNRQEIELMEEEKERDVMSVESARIKKVGDAAVVKADGMFHFKQSVAKIVPPDFVNTHEPKASPLLSLNSVSPPIYFFCFFENVFSLLRCA